MPLPSVKRLTRDFLAKLEEREAAGTAEHPYNFLLRLCEAKGKNGESIDVPMSVRLLAAQSLLRVRMPVLSKSQQDIEVADNRTPQGPGRLEIIQALAAATPEQIKKIFAGVKPLQIEGGTNVTDVT